MPRAMRSKIDLVIHPQRLRIVAILFGREMTIREIALTMPDLPSATLYRHVNQLARGGVITVVAEKRVRGAVERRYTVAPTRAVISPEELRGLDREEHKRMFMTYIATVVGGFERYLGQERIDLLADGVSYTQATLFLTDEELTRYAAEIGAVMQRAAAEKPRPGRRQRTVSIVVVPDPAAEGVPAAPHRGRAPITGGSSPSGAASR